MATGILQDGRDGRDIILRLIENLGVAQGVPPDGAAGDVLKAQPSSTQFFDLSLLGPDFEWPERSVLTLYETRASTGVLTVAYLRLWLYDAISGKAYPAGSGTDADKGKLNNAGTYGEVASDKVRHREVIYNPGVCDGVQVEVGTIAGTTPTFNVDLRIPRAGRL
jgi:hypothetical protein